MIYTDELINELINCDKKIVEPPREIKSSRTGYVKKTFTFTSVDGIHHFNGFITQNSFFAENFSIGLMYNPKDEKGMMVLLRVNGLHGGTEIHPHHATPHIHKATAERINNGLKPEGHIEERNDYTTLDEAIQVYAKLIGLIFNDSRKYFPPPTSQMNLF